MPVQSSRSTIVSGRLPIREGDAPLGHYWGLPIIAGLAMLSVCLALFLPAGRARRLIAPAAGAVVAGAALLHTARERRWERISQRRRLGVLESMIDMTTAMGTSDGVEARTLEQLPDAVRALLGMKMSIVGLLENEGKSIRIHASSGIQPAMVGRAFLLADLPLTRRCIEEKYVTSVADARHPTLPVNSALANELGLRAMVQIPMVYKGEVLGVIVLGDDRPRALTELDRRRAWLWGCHGAGLLSHSRLIAQMSQALERQKTLLEHRDALYDLNTAIQRPGALDETLQRIVDLAPGPLEVDSAVIWMLAEDNPEELVLGAVTSSYGAALVGVRLPVRGSRAELAVKERRSVIVENGPADSALKPQIKSKLPHGSLVFEPMLRGDGQLLGLLVLGRREVGAFRPDQLELSGLFSQRAAAVIEMARLHQQTRADADAKAILLRELNHRVKNNLAAIISLLSIHQPELPRDARRWLNRAIDRIGAMARAHDLFNAGPQRVTLDELVDRTILSLSVVKPAGVTVRTDLSSAHARLRTERAVTLAMAIHELCFNGIVHGMGEAGTLTIRARRNNGSLALEVEDDAGAGRPAAMPIERAPQPGDRSGIGLSLVRGLVGRELHGKFDLAPAPGGAVATVEFPLLPDELSGSAL